MGLRVCLVTPFAWSRPHDVNEHVAGIARELRALGHSVTVLAPSTRAADLIEGRRALLDGGSPEVIALGPAVPVSRRSRIGVPVGVRANLSLALARGEYDVVHGFEPALPSISYLALRDASALTVATFLSPERLAYPPARSRRERLLGRIDALLAPSEEVADAYRRKLTMMVGRFPRNLSQLGQPRERHLAFTNEAAERLTQAASVVASLHGPAFGIDAGPILIGIFNRELHPCSEILRLFIGEMIDNFKKRPLLRLRLPACLVLRHGV